MFYTNLLYLLSLKEAIEVCEKKKRDLQKKNPLTKAGAKKEKRIAHLNAEIREIEKTRQVIWQEIEETMNEVHKAEVAEQMAKKNLTAESVEIAGMNTSFLLLKETIENYYYKGTLTHEHACNFFSNFTRTVKNFYTDHVIEKLSATDTIRFV